MDIHHTPFAVSERYICIFDALLSVLEEHNR